MGDRKRDVGRRPGSLPPGPQPLRVGGAAVGGFEFTVTILVGVFVGRWIDRRLGTGPWLLILGAFVGAAAGFYALYRTLTTGQRAPPSRDSTPPDASE
jgi:ATP synthase protein I